MKNALYFRGDVSTAVDDDPMQSEDIRALTSQGPKAKQISSGHRMIFLLPEQQTWGKVPHMLARR